MSKAENISMGLLALWTGEAVASVKFIEDLAFHRKLTEEQLESIDSMARYAISSLSSIRKQLEDAEK